MDIDFVICWVDGNDSRWQERYLKAKGEQTAINGTRFRDWGLLPYWFRSVEQYAPWVRKVFFVVDEQVPEWLDTTNLKLQVVNHSDFIPDKFLPTFNSNNIELNFHRIEGLREHFVAFNDDMFLNAPVSPDYYFQNGLPCDTPLENIFSSCDYDLQSHSFGIGVTEFCCLQILNAHFRKPEVVKANPKAWLGMYQGMKYWIQSIVMRNRPYFNHFFTPHNEKAFLKTVFEELWEKEPTQMARSCTTFREISNLSIYLMRYWQLASNRFHPVPFMGKRVLQILPETMYEILRELKNPKLKSLCLNDSVGISEEFYENARKKLQDAFSKKFPNKSSFEK